MNETTVQNRLLTWLDVERVFKRHTPNAIAAPQLVTNVRCYADGAEVEYVEDESAALAWLGTIFGNAFDKASRTVLLRIGEQAYPIALERVGPATLTAHTTVPYGLLDRMFDERKEFGGHGVD